MATPAAATRSSERRHGLRSTYCRGCRCDLCRKANAKYAKWRELDGAVQLVDSARVRAHLKELQAAGIGRRTVAKRAGVAESVISRLTGLDKSKPANRVRPDTERRILAVTVEDIAPGANVPSSGTARRLQGLVALGYTQTYLAERIGWTVQNLGTVAHGKRDYVARSTHVLVLDLFNELHLTPGPSDRSRAIAKKYGWVTPLAWDDIDHDDAPVMLEATPRGQAMLEDWHDTYWEHQGDVRAAANRLGVSWAALTQALYRARREGTELTYYNGYRSTA